MRSNSFLAIVGVALMLIGCGSRSSRMVDQTNEFSRNFVFKSLALSPSTATAQGLHDYSGVALDEQLDDFSPAGLNRARQFYRQSLQELNTFTHNQPGDEALADLDTIRLQCEAQLLDLDQIRTYRHNPTLYVETIGNALFSPLVLNYAPESKRITQITARIEKIPRFLQTAETNLADAPEIWNQVAQQENLGNIDLIDHKIRSKVPAALKARYSRAATNALQALNSFNNFLKTDLIRRQCDWRLGARLYAEKFKVTLATGDTPSETLSDAETKLQSIRQDMKRQALAVYPAFFPGKEPPQDLNILVSAVLDKIAQHHTTPERYFSDAKRDLAEATQFVKDHNLLAIPSGGKLEVIPTPEFMRGAYAVGGFSPAPALQPQLGSYYWITPFTSDMTPERVESKLREYDFDGLKILTVHEAMPGHWVQFEYSDKIQPSWRRALRTIYGNGPYVEGWAVYATELMIDQGYQNTPEMRLTFGKQMLRVVANTILDIKLQTMGMTDRQALDLMTKETFQENEEAQQKLRRAKLTSCQLPTYFAGWRGWDRLRDLYRNRAGSEFRLSEFHEKALKEGAVPLPVLKRILLH